MTSSPLNLNNIISAAGLKTDVTSLPGIVNLFVKLVLPLSGLILLGIIIFSGFQILTGASDPKKVDQAKSTLVTSVMGFIVIFAAYWIAQIVETFFNWPIL